MCWVLYLAADRQLPLCPFEPASPRFNVVEVAGREAEVRRQFSKPFVYALGAHTGCCCGFDRGQANPEHPEELAATEASLRALGEFLGVALETAGPLELFACGMVTRPPPRITSGAVGLPTFPRRWPGFPTARLCVSPAEPPDHAREGSRWRPAPRKWLRSLMGVR